ncbi:MAG TPA: response regulator [Pyrinomonadaceae bacterium]
MKEINQQTILVADDENDNLVLVSLWLQNLGYRVVTAVNGEAAVEIVNIARPQLVLMDIAMPVMDGLDATRQLRSHAELNELPVIFITAFDSPDFRQKASDAGGDGYLTKPIDFDRLSNLILTLLPKETAKPAAATEDSKGVISDTTGNLDPRFMLWRMFCAENKIPLDTLPSELNKEISRNWRELKKVRRRPLFKF